MLDPTEVVSTLAARGPAEGKPQLTTLNLPKRMAFLMAPCPAKGMAFLTTPDPMAGPVEVGRLSVQGSTEDGLNHRPNYHLRIRAADWSQVTATSSDTSNNPMNRTTPKDAPSFPEAARFPSDDKGCQCFVSMSPPNVSRDQSRLSALGSAEGGHLSLCPMESCHVPAPAGPLARDGNCPSLTAPGSAEEKNTGMNLFPMESHLLAAASPTLSLTRSLTSPGSHYKTFSMSSVAI